MQKVLTEGSRKGICNICGISCSLTQDHVPPKGSINPRKMGIRSLAQTVNAVDPKIVRLSQNGVKFRSLCSQCNNNRLGKNFDPALNQFSHKVTQIILTRSQLVLPPKVDIKLQPQRIARSVIGHLLAAEIREDMSFPPVSVPMRNLMRQYFLDTSADFPTDLNLYFWPYRSSRQVILRGVGVLSGEHIVVGDFLKYLPVAFWLTYQAPHGVRAIMQDREISIRGIGIDDWSTVAVGTNKQDTFRADWPEAPDNNEVVVINDNLCFIAEAA